MPWCWPPPAKAVSNTERATDGVRHAGCADQTAGQFVGEDAQGVQEGGPKRATSTPPYSIPSTPTSLRSCATPASTPSRPSPMFPRAKPTSLVPDWIELVRASHLLASGQPSQEALPCHQHRLLRNVPRASHQQRRLHRGSQDTSQPIPKFAVVIAGIKRQRENADYNPNVTLFRTKSLPELTALNRPS